MGSSSLDGAHDRPAVLRQPYPMWAGFRADDQDARCVAERCGKGINIVSEVSSPHINSKRCKIGDRFGPTSRSDQAIRRNLQRIQKMMEDAATKLAGCARNEEFGAKIHDVVVCG